ncbi:MAG: ABC transporter ATP-binding protein [Eubacteriales bacterium]|nr:ABC transporter ATP-binding protein [Eubacteriales bacterium]
MIRFKNLTKSYGKGAGIFDFSFEVEEGEVFGLVGPTGSGKTTALRMLMGFEGPSKGRCAINGKDCAEAGLSLHKMIGYLPQNVTLPPTLTARQFLRSLAGMRGIRNLERMFELALRLDVELDERLGKMREADLKKAGIIAALLHSPQVILLDHPFQHLDPKERSILTDLILEEREKNHMIILTTESVDCVDLTCDRVALLDHGNVAYLGDIENLRENMYRNYLIRFSSAHMAMQFSKEHFEIKSMKDRNVIVTVQGALLPLLRALSKYQVTGMEPIPLSLEETFVHIYGGRLHA